MHYKEAFIGGKPHMFIQIGSYDEEELCALGQQEDANVSVELDALHCLRYFPNVTNLILCPGLINKKDLHYLYRLPVKHLKLDYYSDTVDDYTIDLGWFRFLEHVFSRTQYNFQNAKDSESLRTLVVQQWYTSDLSYLDKACIDSLTILSGKLKTLRGIERLPRLKCMEVSHQPALTDVSDIACCPSLEHLRIESCNKLELRQIPELPHLKSLVLYGRQTIDSCGFFDRFPEIERLILDVKILDGDISQLMKLQHCALLTDHRHYTHKNAELPKSKKKV